MSITAEQLTQIETRARGRAMACDRDGQTLADAEFYTHARADVIALLGEIARLRAAAASIREQIAQEIEAERDEVSGAEGATIADERVITSRCNGLAHAARIARRGL